MKTFIQILFATTTLTTGAAGVAKQDAVALPLGVCASLPAFTSFVAGINDPCPKGKTPDVKAYSSNQCTGNSVDAGTLPANHNPSNCAEIAVNTGSGTVSEGGRSARFTCI